MDRDDLKRRLAAIDPTGVADFGNLPIERLEALVVSLETAKRVSEEYGSSLAGDWEDVGLHVVE